MKTEDILARDSHGMRFFCPHCYDWCGVIVTTYNGWSKAPLIGISNSASFTGIVVGKTISSGARKNRLYCQECGKFIGTEREFITMVEEGIVKVRKVTGERRCLERR